GLHGPFADDPTTFIAAWRRTVDLFKAVGADNLSWVWCPGQSYYGESSYKSYPGDAYVDWVCSDGYNWNEPGAYCSSGGNPHPGWCRFAEIFHENSAPRESVELDFRGRKPYMVGEVGTAEGARGQKGEWH